MRIARLLGLSAAALALAAAPAPADTFTGNFWLLETGLYARIDNLSSLPPTPSRNARLAAAQKALDLIHGTTASVGEDLRLAKKVFGMLRGPFAGEPDATGYSENFSIAQMAVFTGQFFVDGTWDGGWFGTLQQDAADAAALSTDPRVARALAAGDAASEAASAEFNAPTPPRARCFDLILKAAKSYGRVLALTSTK